MKYCAYLVVTTILCCLSFVACSNEEEKFENIKFKTTGITLSKPSGTSYYAEIGSAGGIVTITSIGKNAKNGFLSQIKVGNYYYSVTDNDTWNVLHLIQFVKRIGVRSKYYRQLPILCE